MGVYDMILVPCPMCGHKMEAQSKSGDCSLAVYELADAPLDVLGDVNRHAPFECDECGAKFRVKQTPITVLDN